MQKVTSLQINSFHIPKSTKSTNSFLRESWHRHQKSLLVDIMQQQACRNILAYKLTTSIFQNSTESTNSFLRESPDS